MTSTCRSENMKLSKFTYKNVNKNQKFSNLENPFLNNSARSVLIVTHVTVLMSKGWKVVFMAYVHNIDTFNAMSKGSKKP